MAASFCKAGELYYQVQQKRKKEINVLDINGNIEGTINGVPIRKQQDNSKRQAVLTARRFSWMASSFVKKHPLPQRFAVAGGTFVSGNNRRFFRHQPFTAPAIRLFCTWPLMHMYNTSVGRVAMTNAAPMEP